ncbi:hypothetical protein, partial [Streptobacillus moniliformis]|uniref:hypothetical protein n=1 Tax=Streptobacillus moniliformis TaxID=34105 RepID=UPI000AF55233
KLDKLPKNRSYYFNENDMLIMEKLNNIDKVFVENNLYGRDKNGNYYLVSALGKKSFNLLEHKISTGRSFTDEEFIYESNLALIGRTSAINLFGSEKNRSE